jgi:capsular polysaccharide biosynthesis protein
MELREYLAILRRRWVVVVGVTALIALVAAAFTFRGPRSYEATLRLAVSIGGNPAGDSPPYGYFREYYQWLAAEYLADDLSEIVRSDAFISDVRARLDSDLQGAFVREVVRARKTHRIIEVTVQARAAEQAEQMAVAVGEVMRTETHKYLAQLAAPEGRVAVIDEARARPAVTTGSQLADVGLRTALGALVAVFLAFAVDYVDTRFRTAREVERVLGLPILGEIPVENR